MAEHPKIQAIPILDERSASFFALGLAQQFLEPVVLICTSGTAAANYYPALIEANLSHVPLLVLTADRPPELRDCHAGQAMDQLKLYGLYPRWQTELALPSLEMPRLAYLRQTLCQAWNRCQFPTPGPVHLNCPLRDPLAPTPDSITPAFFQAQDWSKFFAPVQAPIPSQPMPESLPWSCWQSVGRGLIIAGPCKSSSPELYARAVHRLSQVLGWPILADTLSPLRHQGTPSTGVISHYDLILRASHLGKALHPDCVLQLGELPTSKPLRTWLESGQVPRWILDPQADNYDPLHGPCQTLRISVTQLAERIPPDLHQNASRPYVQAWQTLDGEIQAQLQQLFSQVDWLCEPKVAWILAQTLPDKTPIFVASSMPVRDVEMVWPPNHTQVQFFFNRGANGIDGTLSTALGLAWQNQPTVLLTGDLALLHDTNGFLLQQHVQGSLTIILLNNQGGGIFGHLPIHQARSVFEPYFATPQRVRFANLAQAYGVRHHLISTWEQLEPHLKQLPSRGIHLLEVLCDRERDAQFRRLILGSVAAGLTLGSGD